MTDARVVLITVPEQELAKKIATHLLESRHAACVNIVGNVRSVYRWKGKIEDDEEILLIVKTNQHCVDALKQAVQSLHSYEVAEVIVLPIVDGAANYLGWLAENCGSNMDSTNR